MVYIINYHFMFTNKYVMETFLYFLVSNQRGFPSLMTSDLLSLSSISEIKINLKYNTHSQWICHHFVILHSFYFYCSSFFSIQFTFSVYEKIILRSVYIKPPQINSKKSVNHSRDITNYRFKLITKRDQPLI